MGQHLDGHKLIVLAPKKGLPSTGLPLVASSCVIVAIALLSTTACTGKPTSQSHNLPSETNVVEPDPTQGAQTENRTPGSIAEPQQADAAGNTRQYQEPKTSEGDSPGKIATALDEEKEREDAYSVSLIEDAEILVFESIARQDCVVRGLIRNESDHLYARDVTVTLAQKDGDGSSVWHWPLTIEPGESAPFEIRIDWFPDLLLDHVPWADNALLEPWGNLDQHVIANFSVIPDIRREITFNADETEYEILYDGSYSLVLFDERAFELEDYLVRKRGGTDYSLFTKEELSFVYPDELVLGVDMEPIFENLQFYKYFDIYFTPETDLSYAGLPGLQNSITELEIFPKIENVKVFQAIMDGSKVLDVWELVPHSISEQVDTEGRILDRRFTPVDTLEKFEEDNYDQVFIRFLIPDSQVREFPQRNWEGEDGKHVDDGKVLYSILWLGGISHEMVSHLQYSVENDLNVDPVSCTAEGGFTKDSWYWAGQQPRLYTDILGSHGVYRDFMPGVYPKEEVVVELDSILVTKNSINGLVRNLSDSHVARRVSVRLTTAHGDFAEDVWHWPLSIQPGERAPFEVSVENVETSIESLQFHVSAEFSKVIDLTRAFVFDTYLNGRVYGPKYLNTYKLGQYDGIRTGAYLDQYALWTPPSPRYLKEEFLELYHGAIIESELDKVELFSFSDFYARLVVPHSHPDLEDAIRNQSIQNLRAFAALFDDNMKVVSIKELVPFTPLYAPVNVDSLFAPVASIPAPNRWSPDAVRLLLIRPYADEADMELGQSYQMWIGGAESPGLSTFPSPQ